MPDRCWDTGATCRYLEINLPHEDRWTFYVTAVVPAHLPQRAPVVGRIVAELARIRLTENEETT